MSSYNLINDVYAAENVDLLTNVLRADWGFKGFVMTDWFGGQNPVAMMKAGNDLLMPGTSNQVKAIIEAVKSGDLSMQVLDRNIARILNILLQSPHFKGYKYSNKPDLDAHASVARSAASEGMVLLKNHDNALPLPSNIRNIAVFGNTSYDLISGGTGSGDVNEAYTVSLVEGLRKSGYMINEGLEKVYSSYLDLAKVGRPSRTGIMMFMGQEPIEEIVINKDIIKGAVATSEAAIITIGRNSGEGRDRLNKPGDFLLSETELQLIKNVSEAYRAKGKRLL
jgi:beta-glucosidase